MINYIFLQISVQIYKIVFIGLNELRFTWKGPQARIQGGEILILRENMSSSR